MARALQVDLISVDSRQLYRGLDLGSGKDLHLYQSPPAVRTHLIDIADPAEVFTLYQFQSAFYQVLEEKSQAEIPPQTLVVCGGTGLYLEAALKRYRIANVPENRALRAELEGRASAELIEELRGAAPELFSHTDISSKKRVIRALEIHRHSLTAPVEYSAPPSVDFTFVVYGLAPSRQESWRRITERLHERLDQGMIEEVKGLMESGLPQERLEMLGMEFREIAGFLRGEKSYSQMVTDLDTEIRHLAKRQETYFKGMVRRGIPITWLPYADPRYILDDLHQRGLYAS